MASTGLASFYGSPFQETSPALLFWTVAGVTQAAWLRGTLPGASRPLGSQEPEASAAGPLRRVLAWASRSMRRKPPRTEACTRKSWAASSIIRQTAAWPTGSAPIPPSPHPAGKPCL